MMFRSARLKIQNRSGLTMLEMIVALALLTIGIAGVLQAFSSSMLTCKEAESYSVAAMLAQQAVSELERRPTLDPGTLSGTFGSDPDYSWEAEIEQATDSGLQRVKLTVFWGPEANRKHFDMLTCLRPGYEQQQEQSGNQPEAPTTGGPNGVPTPNPTPGPGGP